MINEQVQKALKDCSYEVVSGADNLDPVFQLRYACYRAENSIVRNERQRMSDAYDEAENCVHVAVHYRGELLSAVRLHLVSNLNRQAPTLEVFPEVLDKIEGDQTVLDPTRFVVSPKARKARLPMHFLALRVPFLATVFYDVDLALAPVRPEHSSFYRKYLGYETAVAARAYPGLKRPVELLMTRVREARGAVLERTPAFGSVPDIPQADVNFPDLRGIYAVSKAAMSDAA